jgi:hypothetical protein
MRRRCWKNISCNGGIRASFILNVGTLAVAQGDPKSNTMQIFTIDDVAIYTAVLVLRIWFLFQHSRSAQLLVVACFIVCSIAECATLGLSFKDLHSVSIPIPLRILRLGCTAPPPSKLWRMFIPAFVLHTILYLFTAYRGLRNRSVAAESAPLIRRLLRDGGILYFVVFCKSPSFSNGAGIFTFINLPQSPWASRQSVLQWRIIHPWV